jgi:hypothetical protein
MSPLDWLDVAFVMVGALILAIGLLRWRRRGWPDLLRSSPIRANTLSLLLVWLCLAAYVVGGAVGSLLGLWLVPASLVGPAGEAWQGVLSASATQLLAAATCVVVARWAFASGLRGFGLGRRSSGSELAWSLAGWFVALSLCGCVIWVTEVVVRFVFPAFKPPDHSVFVTLSAPEVTTGMRVLAIGAAALFAPIGEELFFRGILQSAFKKLFPRRWGSRRHRWFAIGLSAVAFGLMHWGTPQFIPALICLGVILGYLYERRGSLIVPIAVHILFNAKSLLWYHLQIWYGFGVSG